jgi:hypothetical protein
MIPRKLEWRKLHFLSRKLESQAVPWEHTFLEKSFQAWTTAAASWSLFRLGLKNRLWKNRSFQNSFS